MRRWGYETCDSGLTPRPHTPSGLTASSVARDTLEVLGSYVLPFRPGGVVEIAAGLAVLALVAAGAVAGFHLRSAPALFLAMFACGYVATLIYSEFATVISAVNERLLAPVFPSLVILIILGCTWLCGWSTEHLAKTGNWPRTSLIKPIALTLLVATFTASVTCSTTVALEHGRTGIGYNSVASRTSPTALSVLDLPSSAGFAT